MPFHENEANCSTIITSAVYYKLMRTAFLPVLINVFILAD